jgi:uncharacterized membrane protein (DUF4010 family)
VDLGIMLGLAVALGIGMLLGTERERRREEGDPSSPAFGLRTFTLVALLGGVTALTGQLWLTVVAGLFVVGAALLSYFSEHSRGLTTEAALVLAFVLGVLAQDRPEIAGALGVVVTGLLYARSELHRVVRKVLTDEEIRGGLMFAAAALVVLPLVPDQPIDPFGVLNPLTLWTLVVVVMAISLGGYIAVRVFGPRYGLPLAGLGGGFVSGIATIGAMGRRGKDDPNMDGPAAVGATLASVATVATMVVVLFITNVQVLLAMVWPLAAACIAAIGYGIGVWLLNRRASSSDSIEPGRPVDIKGSVLFALIVTAVLFAGAVLNAMFGVAGVTVSTALAGLADSHAAAISAASLTSGGQFTARDAVVPILLALTTNTGSKAFAARAAGSWRFTVTVWIGLVLFALAPWAGWALELSGVLPRLGG